MRITKTNSPLYFSLSFDGVNLPNYQIGVTQETNKNANLRGKVARYGALNEKTEYFKITKIVGAVEAPDALVLEVGDLKEQATVSKEKPYKVIAGYTSDLDHAKFISRRPRGKICCPSSYWSWGLWRWARRHRDL